MRAGRQVNSGGVVLLAGLALFMYGLACLFKLVGL